MNEIVYLIKRCILVYNTSTIKQERRKTFRVKISLSFHSSRYLTGAFCFKNMLTCDIQQAIIKSRREEENKMKAEFKNGYFNACYGGSTIYEKSTLQSMTKSELIELIECAQHNYEVVIDERNYFYDMVLDMVLSMNKE